MKNRLELVFLRTFAKASFWTVVTSVSLGFLFSVAEKSYLINGMLVAFVHR